MPGLRVPFRRRQRYHQAVFEPLHLLHSPTTPDEILRLVERPPMNVYACDRDLRVTKVLYNEIVSGDPQRFIGTTDHDWLEPDEAEIIMGMKRQAMHSGAVVREMITLRIDGEPRQYSYLVLADLDNRGITQGLICIVADITERMNWLKAAPPDPDRLLGRFSPEALPLDTPPAAHRVGDLLVDSGRHGLLGPIAEVRLTRTEWLVLQQLIESQGRVLAREALLAKVWGPEYVDEHSLLHDTISRLRHRFHQAGFTTDPIETVYGIGYRLVEPST
ncbi:MAG TPA: winged helix-turn-helix domain-containing protein [Dehalococcoidia bacterium]|nr:winged helix-turn-helix domain-containing protein [Dehalococcoidia bacterium]